jgi:GntR family transcriptional regulator/MocR family aminotransferase
LILDGRLRAGDRLPSTRMLARDLRLSRTTVVNALEQLALEGYVQGRVGSGTRVATAIPADVRRLALSRKAALQLVKAPTSSRAQLSAAFAWGFDEGMPRPLRPGHPDIRLLPLTVWARLTARHWRRSPERFALHADSNGYAPLREAICDYVWRRRAVTCDPEQILIVAGAQHALFLSAHVLLDAQESVWMEDPGYPRARAAFRAAGLNVVPVPVDSQGLDVQAAIGLEPSARLAYVTPSFQCPLGSVLSLSRRFELLRHITRNGGWILEDDYFHEYRYGSDPIASLQSLDQSGRVIYIGNFSKSIVPFLRIGFLVVPPALVDAFRRIRAALGRQPPGIDQAALADFITEGHLERHLRTTLEVYRERQEVLINVLEQRGDGMLEPSRGGTATYLVARLKRGVDDRSAAGIAARHQVESVPLSAFSIRPLKPGGLVLGYSGYETTNIRKAASQLCAAMRSMRGPGWNR